MDTKIPLYEIPVPSTDIVSPVRLADTGAQLSLSFDYRVDGKMEHSGLEFQKVRAYRHRAEVHCTKWHIEDAYDTLVEIRDSAWANEIRSDTAEGWKNEWSLRHFMIYLDSAGSYEILAESWNPTGVITSPES